MSRISQTLSLISNLSSPGSDTRLLEDEKVETISKQFIPRRQRAVLGDQFIFQTTSLRQRINARLVLLAPLPCDIPPFAKSVFYLSSLTGSITANVFRHPGAETHVFCLYIFAREADVKVTLPSLFRGVVNVKSHDGSYHRRQAGYCRAFRHRVRCGLIRLDSCMPMEDGDEVYIHAEGKIEIRLMPLSKNDGSENAGSRVGRHVRRLFAGRQLHFL